MAYTATITAFINQQLQNGLTKPAFANRKVIEVAQSMPRYDAEGVALQLLPSYVNADGEACYVGPEDEHDLILYHRVNRIGVAKGKLPASYGNDGPVDVNTVSMSLVVFGKRDVLCMSSDELALLLQANFPEAATKELLKRTQLNVCNLKISDINLNNLQVFQEEFQGIAYFLKPEQFLFKLNYTIESAFLKGCFANCK